MSLMPRPPAPSAPHGTAAGGGTSTSANLAAPRSLPTLRSPPVADFSSTWSEIRGSLELILDNPYTLDAINTYNRTNRRIFKLLTAAEVTGLPAGFPTHGGDKGGAGAVFIQDGAAATPSASAPSAVPSSSLRRSDSVGLSRSGNVATIAGTVSPSTLAATSTGGANVTAMTVTTDLRVLLDDMVRRHLKEAPLVATVHLTAKRSCRPGDADGDGAVLEAGEGTSVAAPPVLLAASDALDSVETTGLWLLQQHADAFDRWMATARGLVASFQYLVTYWKNVSSAASLSFCPKTICLAAWRDVVFSPIQEHLGAAMVLMLQKYRDGNKSVIASASSSSSSRTKVAPSEADPVAMMTPRTAPPIHRAFSRNLEILLLLAPDARRRTSVYAAQFETPFLSRFYLYYTTHAASIFESATGIDVSVADDDDVEVSSSTGEKPRRAADALSSSHTSTTVTKLQRIARAISRAIDVAEQLHISSVAPFKSIVLEALVDDHYPDITSEFEAWLESGRTAELKLLFDVACESANGIAPLAARFQAYVPAALKSLLATLLPIPNRGTVAAAGGASLADARDFVATVSKRLTYYRQIVTYCFCGRREMQEALTRAMTHAVNHNAWCEAFGLKAAEFVARAAHAFLRTAGHTGETNMLLGNGAEGAANSGSVWVEAPTRTGPDACHWRRATSQAEGDGAPHGGSRSVALLEDPARSLSDAGAAPPSPPPTTLLDDVVAVFSFVDDKDIFQSVYAEHLARRLIFTGTDVSLERLAVATLRKLTSYEFTFKWARMINDFDGARELNAVADESRPPWSGVTTTTDVGGGASTAVSALPWRGYRPFVVCQVSWPTEQPVPYPRSLPAISSMNEAFESWYRRHSERGKDKRLQWSVGNSHGVMCLSPAAAVAGGTSPGGSPPPPGGVSTPTTPPTATGTIAPSGLLGKGYEFSVTWAQAALLACFTLTPTAASTGDDCVSNAFSLSQLCDLAGLPPAVAVKAGQALIKVKLLVAQAVTGDVNPEASPGSAPLASANSSPKLLRVNMQFRSANRRVNAIPGEGNEASSKAGYPPNSGSGALADPSHYSPMRAASSLSGSDATPQFRSAALTSPHSASGLAFGTPSASFGAEMFVTGSGLPQPAAAPAAPTPVSERKFALQAAIMRIMKTRQSLRFPDLVAEAIAVLQAKLLYTPSNSDVKAAIDSLIEREFLERAANDRELLRYVA